MSITIGFILIFILVVIPGLLFQRFYYFGEFSKQFSTKDTVYKSVFYSVIPGISVQVLGAFIYFSFHKNSFENIFIHNIIQETLAPHEGQKMSTDTINFINDDIYFFLAHTVNVYFLAILLGYVTTRAVRYFNLDKKFKIIRFKNQWYYIFSGEILTFEKFKKVDTVIGEVKGSYDKFKHYPPYADILCESNGESALYSGYIIDYDLDHNNISNLEKLYLIGTHRFRKKKESDSEEKIYGSRTKVPIQGNVFILSAKNIQNINLTFVPKPLEGQVTDDSKRQIVLKRIYRAFLVLQILIIPLTIFFDYSKSDNDLLINITKHINESSKFQLTLLVLVLVQLISVFAPQRLYKENIKEEEKEEKVEPTPYFEYSFKYIGYKLIFLLILSLLYWYIYL